MDTKQICKECGAPLAADAPQGLCPNCLMKVAMGSEARIPGVSNERKPAPPPEEIAKHFPQFEILALLGQGGMGAVYKARQPSLDRIVALKILPAQAAADAGFAERFNREARALAKLNHPNIVAVYDFGQTDGAPAPADRSRRREEADEAGAETSPPPHVGSYHYLIMEYVDGLNLRQLQQTGKLPPCEALQIIPQICEALQFAHDEGVVHRDIKPENVLLDKKGRVKIADFGLAKILGREPESYRLTGAKDFMGTPHYMAPEQIEHPQAVDHRADIYSLGVVFYEMLTGELPLGKFQPPSKKVQVDVRFDEVVLHALEKEPERRYQHASEVKTDVESIAGKPKSPESSARSLAAAKQRHGLRVKAACFFFAAVCFLIAAVSFASSDNPTAALLSAVGIVGFSIAGFRHLLGAAALNAPPSPPVSAQEIETVRGQVKGPAIGLLVTGIANWILLPLILALLLPNAMHTAKTAEFPQIVAFGLALLPLVLCSFMIYAAFKMMQLERRGAAIAASVFAMLVTPGNLIGLPMGVWALVVLGRRDVKAAFTRGGGPASQWVPPANRARSPLFTVATAILIGLGLVLLVAMTAGVAYLALSHDKAGSVEKAQSTSGLNETRLDDVADVPSEQHFAADDTNKLYFLIGRPDVTAGGKNPRPLLLVLPGGDGGRDFHPFVKRICKNALPEGYLVAQLVAPKWDESQFEQLVWPTEKSPYPAMQFPTEAFVSAVVADIEKQHPLDSRRVFTLSWSSGGPAGYATSLYPNTRVTGSLVAMSVFKPDQLPEITAAKDHAYYLLHSPTDFIPMRMPEQARDSFTSNGAKVHLQAYQGGHGWHGNVFGMIGEGIRWLEQQTTSRSAPPVASATRPELLKAELTLPFKNIGMEEGSDNPATWQKGPPVAGVEQTWDRTTAHGGKASLCLKKTVQRFFPISQWSQTVTVEPVDNARKVSVRCWVKAENVTKAIVDVTYQGKQSGHVWAVFLGQKEQTDPVATHDWKLWEGIVKVPAQTSRLGIAFQIYGPGAVWFDDLEVAWVE